MMYHCLDAFWKLQEKVKKLEGDLDLALMEREAEVAYQNVEKDKDNEILEVSRLWSTF